MSGVWAPLLFSWTVVESNHKINNIQDENPQRNTVSLVFRLNNFRALAM